MIAGVTHDPADFVWAGSVLHCMPEEDCRAFLNSAYQLLKPGGFLYGMTAGKHESTEWTLLHRWHTQRLSVFTGITSSHQYFVYLHWTVGL